MLNFSQFIPILLLAPWAGGASDRWNRRQLLLVTQSVAVVLSGGLGLLAYFDLAPTWVVIADAVALGVQSAFSAPAQQALITQLVDEPEVPTAVALNSLTFNLARAIGPASAALAVQYLGIPAAFGLNAVSYLIFIGALLFIGPQAQQLAERSASYLGASIGILRRRPQLVVFLLIVAAVGFASDPVNTLAPAWAHAFGRQDTVAGYIIGVFGAGAVTAGLVVAGRVGGSRRRMFTTLLMLSLGMIAFSITPWLPLALPFLFVAGFGYLASNTHATSRLQLGVEPWERGRIMALWSVAFLGLRPFASIIDGADRERVRRPLRRCAAGTAGPRLRGLDRSSRANSRLGRGACRAAARDRLGDRDRGPERGLVQALARRAREYEDRHRTAAGEGGRDVVADHRAERRPGDSAHRHAT